MTILVFVLFAFCGIMGFPLVYSQDTSYCSAYTASKTNSATTYYCTCSVHLCPGDTLYLDGCSKCSGYQYFRLLDSAGELVTTSEAYTSRCYPCGEISGYKPLISSCETFSIRQGCYLQNTCGGKVRVRVYNATANATSQALLQFSDPQLVKINTDLETSRILRASSSSSSSSSSGYCNRDAGLTVGGIIAAVLVPLFCCGFCFVFIFQLVQRQHSAGKVVPGGGGGFTMMPAGTYASQATPVVAIPANQPPIYQMQGQPMMYQTGPVVFSQTYNAQGTPIAVPVH